MAEQHAAETEAVKAGAALENLVTLWNRSPGTWASRTVCREQLPARVSLRAPVGPAWGIEASVCDSSSPTGLLATSGCVEG